MTRALATDRPAAEPRLAEYRAVQVWLYAVAMLVALMVMVGGATRLTGSGLSITEWQPMAGLLPPLSATDWHQAFRKYQETLQYQVVNKGMSLEAFKVIYWWEWSHRFLGRLIGFAFVLPLVWFWARGKLPRDLTAKLAGVLALGGLQGVMGWIMVQSGLADRVDVSQIRLALHLALAIAIFGLLLWLALGLGAPSWSPGISPGQRWTGGLMLVLVFVQIVFGALVAGLKAGLVYTTWPLMDGRIVPSGLWTLDPWYLNHYENVTTVQFQHRATAYALLAVSLWHASSVRVEPALARSAADLAAALILQALLGIWTLVAAASGEAPIALALAHQAGAVVVFGLAVRHAHRLFRAA